MKLILNFLNSKSNSYFKITVLNYILKALFISLNLLMIPLLLDVLGKERFGIWQTMLSIISFISVLNFGLGNGLRNLITKLSISGKNKEIGKAIGATYKKVTKIIIFATLITLPLVIYFLNPTKLFANSNTDNFEIKASFIIFLIFFFINIILGLANSIAFGIQKSYLTGIIQFIYLFICYLLIFSFFKFYKLDLIEIAFIFGFVQSICYLGFLIFQNKHFNLNISFKSKFDLREVTKLSINFFLVQLLALIFLAVDNFVISLTLGASQTAEFSVVNKIYFTLINLFSVLLIHFWNSVTEKFEKNETYWIFKTIKTLYFAAIGVLLVGLLIAFFQNEIINLWLGKNAFQITSLTFFLFAFYAFFHCINAIYINLQNGIGLLKLQIYSTSIALFLYGLGCYLIDIKAYGYEIIIILKIGVTIISILINVFILNKLKKV